MPASARKHSSAATAPPSPNRVTLELIIRGRGPGAPLTVPAALYVAWQLSRAIALLHSRGQVHGAVSPSHVLLAGDGKVQLRIARTIPGALATPSVVVRRGNDAPSMRSDLRAVGSILFELLTGLSETQARTKVADPDHTRCPAPSHFNPGVDRATDEVVTRCLSANLSERPESALDLVRDLARCYRVHAGSLDWDLPAGALCSTTLSTFRGSLPPPLPSWRTRSPAAAAGPESEPSLPVVVGALLDPPSQ